MLLSLLMSLSALNADTLAVNQAQMEGPYSIQQPYVTDSLNMQQKAFDIHEVLKQNQSLVSKSRYRKVTTTTIHKGDALTVGTDSLSTLRLLHFNVETPKFIKGRFDVKNLKNYKLYVDGVECSGNDFKAAPGRSAVTLQVLTQKDNKDSLNIRLIGDDLKDVVVNATGKRPYTMADMIQGEHYRSVALSPSGKYLVTTSYYMKPNGQAQYTTILQNMVTGEELLHRNDYMNLNSLKSGKDILYYTRPGGTGKELVMFDPDNRQERVLADNLPDGGFTIAPNEEYLIISKVETGKGSTNGLKMLQNPDDRMPNWRNRTSLWRYDIKSGVLRRLSFGATSVYLADISDDSRKLLLQYSRFDASKRPFNRTGILTMDAYTGKIDTLLNDTAFVNSAKFSPNAKQLLLTASPASFDGIGLEVKPGQHPNVFDVRLYLYDPASHKVTPLLRNFKPSVEDFEWNRGDNQVYFTAADRTDRSLFRLNVNTHEVVKYDLPVTLIHDYSIASSGKNPKAVFFGNCAERAREMFTCSLNKSKPEAKRIGSIDFDKLYGDVAIGTCHDLAVQGYSR